MKHSVIHGMRHVYCTSVAASRVIRTNTRMKVKGKYYLLLVVIITHVCIPKVNNSSGVKHLYTNKNAKSKVERAIYHLNCANVSEIFQMCVYISSVRLVGAVWLVGVSCLLVYEGENSSEL